MEAKLLLQWFLMSRLQLKVNFDKPRCFNLYINPIRLLKLMNFFLSCFVLLFNSATTTKATTTKGTTNKAPTTNGPTTNSPTTKSPTAEPTTTPSKGSSFYCSIDTRLMKLYESFSIILGLILICFI